MSDQCTVKAHYLDASALVKLVADDADEVPGRDELRKYYQSHASKYATSYCVAETFSAFKTKFLRKKIDKSQYLKYVRAFINSVIGENLRIENEIPILTPKLLSEAERMIGKYELDFIDCLQIVTIRHGRYGTLVEGSASILITADRKLAEVARLEGAKVWECTCEPAPA